MIDFGTKESVIMGSMAVDTLYVAEGLIQTMRLLKIGRSSHINVYARCYRRSPSGVLASVAFSVISLCTLKDELRFVVPMFFMWYR